MYLTVSGLESRLGCGYINHNYLGRDIKKYLLTQLSLLLDRNFPKFTGVA